MSPLRQRMSEDLRLRGYAVRTQKTYLDHVRCFARYFGRSPEELGPEEIRSYQLHLVEKGVSWSLLGQASAALRFLYTVTLGQPWRVEKIASPRRPKRLPVVLSTGEVARLLEAVPRRKQRLVLIENLRGGAARQ